MPRLEPTDMQWWVALLILLYAASANAECLYPEAPAAIPDGATATYEEMVQAHRIVMEFDADIRNFTVCLALEAQELLESSELDEAKLENLQAHLVALNDTAVSEAEFVVEQFNQQLRIFRGRDSQ